MNKKMLLKLLVKAVSTASVGVVIDNIVKSTTPLSVGPLNRIAAQIGGFILSGMIGDKAGEYVEEQITGIFPDKKEEEPK